MHGKGRQAHPDLKESCPGQRLFAFADMGHFGGVNEKENQVTVLLA